ncbi:MAG: hypothetical protein AABX55_02615 [Nanoarchaeota archaeon]
MPKDEVDNYEEGHEGIYNERFREELEENDEISEKEEGFMEGYDKEEAVATCAKCRRILFDHNIIEEEINDKHYRFCSQECADKFMKKI